MHDRRRRPVRSALLLAGLDSAAVGQVVCDCYDMAAAPQRTAEITRGTVAMCRSAAVLDVPGRRRLSPLAA